MTNKTIGIFSDIFIAGKKSAIGKISYDLYFYLKKYGFNVGLIDNSKTNNFIKEQILLYDVVIGIPDLDLLNSILTDDERKSINSKVIPIFHHYPFTPFEHFRHKFFHGFWTEELGYTNNKIGEEIDNLAFKYKKVYLPIGINTLNYFPTRKITKIKKIGFVGKLSNIKTTGVESWVLNKRPQLFIDICEAVNIEFVSISESKNSDEDGHKLYDDIDLIICTSVEEGGPLGLLESVACKIPFISTNVGLVKEFNNIKTFNTVKEAISIINDLNSSEEGLTNYINNLYDEIIPNRDWRNLIPKYWLPHIIKKINSQSHYDFIEIGTSDFSTLLQENPDKRGISIEPIKVYYDALPNPIKGYKLQCAVSDFDGTIEMNWIHPSDIIDHSLPDWLRGCNSIGPHVHHDKFSSNLIKKELVKTIKWDTLVKMYDIQSVDVIKIDTQGHDHIILSQILNHCKNTYFRPIKIIFENNELADKDTINTITKEFEKIGYEYIEGYDSTLTYNKYKKYE
jgi:FkbM family methyltransferase